MTVAFCNVVGPLDTRVADVAGKGPLELDPRLNLGALTLEELHRVVSWLSIVTSAETEADLIIAINLHLGVP